MASLTRENNNNSDDLQLEFNKKSSINDNNNTKNKDNNTNKSNKPYKNNNGKSALRVCIICRQSKKRNEYSSTQWKKGNAGSKCKSCIMSNQSNRNNLKSSSTNSNSNKNNNDNPTTKPLIVKPRPQMPVPGFEETLTCCTDWPQTKKGEPPSAQSLVFMPLFAIIHGPLPNYCNELQLSNALNWWTAALPAFPSWIDRLIQAGVKRELLKIVSKKQDLKGRPNALIPKIKGGGHGSFPHIKGKVQTRLLEMDIMVSIEIYQAVACMYSQKKLSAEEAAQ